MYERFCLVPKAESIPNKFFEMLRILRRNDCNLSESELGDEREISRNEDKSEDRWNLLLEAIKEKMGSYITQVVSDRTRSRYCLRIG